MARALGRYELVRPLARGGMAEVFLARRRAGGVEKLLVVKRIRAERAGDARFLELFVKEARLSMSLAHQNIVPVFDFGRTGATGEQVFLAMERVEGKDLGSSLARATQLEPKRPLPALVAAFIATESLQALDYAHRRTREDGEALGIVHRDVTPRNVLLSWSGEVKLTDFGIAALAGEDTSTLVGTPAYMAPEQARGEPVDARADVYAIGLVLREALTGTRARPGDDRESIVAAAKAGALADWPADAPPALVAIIDRATTPAPADRYPDARAMLEALDGFLVAERAANRGESPARQLATWLADVWAGERDDKAELTPADPSGELLSFLDDEDGGTARSLAATVDDAPTPAPAPAPAPAPQHSSFLGMLLSRRRSPANTRPVPSQSAVNRSAWFALFAIVAVAAILVEFALRRPATKSSPVPLDAAVATIPLDATSADATVDATLTAVPPADASLDAVIAVPLDATRDKPRPKPDAGTPRPDAAAVQAKRNVRINALPWATFTVDDDPTSHETIGTVELTPGTHRIRFTNPTLNVTRDVTIVVPADRDIDHVEDLRK